jgi:hypothetical protein
MLRARVGILIAGVAVLVVLGAASFGRVSSAIPAAPTTVPPTTAAPTTTAPGPTIPGPVVTAPLRGGAPAGSTAKPSDEEWTLRQVLTTVGVIVGSLAVLGFVYGRIRSMTPRSPGLAPMAD